MKLQVLQSILHLGALTESSTSVPPSHSGHALTPFRALEWGHVGCGHSVHGIPDLLPATSVPSCIGRGQHSRFGSQHGE